jgi:uncharacterized membrane protein YraQ (UPF0718 family)
MEPYLEDWVRNMPRTQASAGGNVMTLPERIDAGLASVREIVGRVWPYILTGIAIGAGIIPIVQALLANGAALGTVLALMMSVIGLSAPEMVILRKVLKPRLIATFVGVVATGILVVGFVFNAVL